MIVVKKKMKKSLLISILSAVLAVLIAGAIVVSAIVDSKSGDTSGSTNSSSQILNFPEIREEVGEIDNGGTPYAFYPVDREKMNYIQIRSEGIDENGDSYTYEYSFTKLKDLDNEFVLSYTDKDGKTRTYAPTILAYDSETTYSSLYATESSSGYNIPLLYWLCSGIGNVAFSDRVDLSEDGAAREKELEAYGLGEADTPLVIRFNYEKTDKTNEDIVLQIGDVLPSGNGYYYRVGKLVEENGETVIDYRPCVYATFANTSLSYAFLTFADFINPILIAKGLAADNAFEPYLTTDYKQWKNTFYKHEDGKEGIAISDAAYLLMLSGMKYSPNDTKGGIDTDKDIYEFNLKDLAEMAKTGKAYASLLQAIKEQGKTGPSAIKVTIPSYNRALKLDDTNFDWYTYEIVSIDAVLSASNDVALAGAVVQAGDSIKVSYKLLKNGEYVKGSEKQPLILEGVLDLSSENVPDSAKEALVGKTVGAVEGVSFKIDYNSQSTKMASSVFAYRVVEIIDIRKTGNLGETLETVQTGATVSLRVYDVVDGKDVGAPYTIAVEITGEMSGVEALIAERIMGKKTTRDIDEIVVRHTAYYEAMQGFITYDITDVIGFTEREEIVAFRYTQNSQRDPYYGESIYTNTMEDAAMRLYALEANSCEKTVQILGGLLENATSSEGLKGLKTVDVVITPEKIIRYGLYANTIYFELPRNILPVTDDSNDYTWHSSLGFTLYISDEDPVTKKRYIASDMYDVIAEIDGKGFEFLDETFLSLFARRNLVLTSIENINNFDIEFFTDEISGTYLNRLKEVKLYAYNDVVYESLAKLQQEHGKDAKYTEISIIRIATGYVASHACNEEGCNHLKSLLQTQLEQTGKDRIALDVLYGGATTPSGQDLLGSDGFKEFLGTLFYTIYQDELSDADKANIVEENLLMRIKVDLGESYPKPDDAYRFVYEFYRVSDRRVAVRLYKETFDGKMYKENGKETSTADYYISSFAFKKLVSKYWELVNAKVVNKEDAFTDYEIWN